MTTYLEYLAYKYEHFSKSEPTLAIVSLGLGLWVAGIKVAQALREIANRGVYPLTVAVPGIEIEDTVQLLLDMGPYFRNIFFIGYPPVVKVILEEAARQGINWKDHNVNMMVGGEGHSEAWREYIANIAGYDVDGRRNLGKIISLYAAADIGTIGGFESQLSVLIRRLAKNDHDLACELFGRSDRLPQLFQYAASSNYLEIIDNEVVFTSLTGIPIVRYNMHDQGGRHNFEAMFSLCKKHGYDLNKIMNERGYNEGDNIPLDFCYVFGRTDGTQTIYGVNIYVENIKEALGEKELSENFSGAFKIETLYDNEQNQYLQITIELNKGIENTDQLQRYALERITDSLKAQNSEYAELYNNRGNSVAPKITLVDKIEKGKVKNKYT